MTKILTGKEFRVGDHFQLVRIEESGDCNAAGDEAGSGSDGDCEERGTLALIAHTRLKVDFFVSPPSSSL